MNLEEVEQARTGSIEVVLTDGKAGTDKSNVKNPMSESVRDCAGRIRAAQSPIKTQG